MTEARVQWGVVVLAAGRGTRMKSSLPKVLHVAAGQTLVDHVLDLAVAFSAPSSVTVVVGHQAARVAQHVAVRGVRTVLQEPQLGTGHALQVAIAAPGADRCEALVVLSGDVPALRPVTVDALREAVEAGADAALLTAELDDPGTYGRVLRDSDGQIRAVVEAGDADAATRAVREVNAGVYAFRTAPLCQALAGLDSNNAQGEYYLTDVVATLRRQGFRVVPQLLADPLEMQGVNSQLELAEIDAILRAR